MHSAAGHGDDASVGIAGQLVLSSNTVSTNRYRSNSAIIHINERSQQA